MTEIFTLAIGQPEILHTLPNQFRAEGLGTLYEVKLYSVKLFNGKEEEVLARLTENRLKDENMERILVNMIGMLTKSLGLVSVNIPPQSDTKEDNTEEISQFVQFIPFAKKIEDDKDA